MQKFLYSDYLRNENEAERLWDNVFLSSAVIADQDGIEIASSPPRERDRERERERERAERREAERKHMALKFSPNDPETQ